MTQEVHDGGCLCGAVRYRVAGPMRPVVECHCGQCRSTHGHFAAYTAAPREAIEMVEDQGLRWYESSPGIRRGFCATCGSSLFWDRGLSSMRSIAAGTLESPTGLKTVGRIYVADAGDYYTIDESLPCFPASDGGALDSDAT